MDSSKTIRNKVMVLWKSRARKFILGAGKIIKDGVGGKSMSQMGCFIKMGNSFKVALCMKERQIINYIKIHPKWIRMVNIVDYCDYVSTLIEIKVKFYTNHNNNLIPNISVFYVYTFNGFGWRWITMEFSSNSL